MPGLPLLRRQGRSGTQIGRRPQGLRLPRLDPRPAGEPASGGLLRQGPPVRRDGRVEEELQALPQAARRRGRFRRLVRRDPPGRPPRNGSKTRGRRTSRAGALPEGMRHVPPRRRAERGRRGSRAPKLFAWGSPQWIARMIRKPGAPTCTATSRRRTRCPRSPTSSPTNERRRSSVTSATTTRGHLPLGGPAQDRGGQGGRPLRRSTRACPHGRRPSTGMRRHVGTGDDSGPCVFARGAFGFPKTGSQGSSGPGPARVREVPVSNRCATLASRSAEIEKKGENGRNPGDFP